MTTDARALIADYNAPGMYGDALDRWLRKNLAAIMAGYERALDEVEGKDKTIERLVARIAATDAPADIDDTLASLEAARAQIVRLRTELGEAKLVIEQQDRDLAASRDINRHFEQERDSWPLAYRQRAAQTDKRIAELEQRVRDQDEELQAHAERAYRTLQGDPCTDTTTK